MVDGAEGAVLVEFDGDDIDAEGHESVLRMGFEVVLDGVEELALLGACDGQGGHALVRAATGAHFYEHCLLAINGHEVDLSLARAELAVDDADALRLEVRGSCAFAEVAHLLAFARQRRSRR